VTHPLASLALTLSAASVRYVLIGVAGANLYAPAGQAIFATEDFDLFLPLDVDNLLQAWMAAEQADLELWLNGEPLGRPRDRWLAERVIASRATIRITGPADLAADLTLMMAGYQFEEVWTERRTFVIDGVEIPVARLLHIVTSKHAAGRDKDHLFLATHREALEQLLKKPDDVK
jgi:hypothetical protein